MLVAITNRTVATKISLLDAEFFLKLANTDGWLRFIGDRQIETTEDAEAYIANSFLKTYDDHQFGYYIVKDASQTHSLGIAGFLKKPFLQNPDFGFAFLPEHTGQGLAYESCRAILKFGVTHFKFSVLDAVTDPSNQRSIRLLEKLDFQYDNAIESDKEPRLCLYRRQFTGDESQSPN